MNVFEIALDKMMNAGVERKVALRYMEELGKRLTDVIDEEVSRYIEDEIPRIEEDAKAASEDAYWEHKIDEYQEEK